jgi:hypothetical protein
MASEDERIDTVNPSYRVWTSRSCKKFTVSIAGFGRTLILSDDGSVPFASKRASVVSFGTFKQARRTGPSFVA